MFKETVQSTNEALETKSDEELEALIVKCRDLLTSRDRDRKAKALAEARKIAAAAGLRIMEKKTRKRAKRKTRSAQTGDTK